MNGMNPEEVNWSWYKVFAIDVKLDFVVLTVKGLRSNEWKKYKQHALVSKHLKINHIWHHEDMCNDHIKKK